MSSSLGLLKVLSTKNWGKTEPRRGLGTCDLLSLMQLRSIKVGKPFCITGRNFVRVAGDADRPSGIYSTLCEKFVIVDMGDKFYLVEGYLHLAFNTFSSAAETINLNLAQVGER